MTATITHDAPSSPRMNGVLFLLTLSVLINYIDRSNLSIAAPLIKDELRISASQLGILLSAFFWTYALMQIPAGWLVDRFDVKWVFAAGFFVWSAATAVTGILRGFAALLIVRVILVSVNRSHSPLTAKSWVAISKSTGAGSPTP